MLINHTVYDAHKTGKVPYFTSKLAYRCLFWEVLTDVQFTHEFYCKTYPISVITTKFEV